MAEYNIRGNKLANLIYDTLLKPEENPSYDGPIPEKPAGLEELPPNINMTTPPIKNLSDMKTKTPQEQYEHDVQMKNPASAYTRKEKEDLKKLIEVAKEAGVLKDDADLAEQTPAGEASAGDILPGNDYINPAETKSEPVSNSDASDNSKNTSTSTTDNTDNSNGSSSNDKTKQEAKQQAKQESRYKLRSIMDAYNEGLLDEKSRDYLIIDTLSKFARNMGKDIANIAAAYTGGTINNEREEPIWSKRNEEMAKKGINAEGNRLRNEDNYDLDYQSQKLDLAKKQIKMVPPKNFQEMAKKMRKDGNETGAALMDLIAAASTQSVDMEEYIASLYGTNPDVEKLVNNSIGAVSNVAGALGDLAGDVEELLKSARGKAVDSANKSTGRRIADAAFDGNPLYNLATNYMDK